MDIDPFISCQLPDGFGFKPTSDNLPFAILEEDSRNGSTLLVLLRNERTLASTDTNGDNRHS